MKKLSILSLLLLTLFACRKDIEEPINSEIMETPTVTTIIDYDEEEIPVNATLFGIVSDESDNPIVNATVSLGNLSTTTDDRGRFVFKEVAMNQAGTFYTVNKTGYFEGSDRFYPVDGSTNYSKVVLLAQAPIGNFTSNEGGTVTSAEGLSLEFPANAIIDANGNTYNGEVTVAARWIDPTLNTTHEMMPGDLQGLQSVEDEVELVALASFGMVAVELEGVDGNPLNLGNDLKATLTFPIADAQLGLAADEIPLWSFSNEYGLWVKEGTATKDGNNYVGEVAHFSWWNCDAPFPLIELSGTLNTSNDSSYIYQTVCIEVVSTGDTRCGYTDVNGFFSGKVPMDEELILTVYSWNGCAISYTENIGPFSVDTDLGTITIPDPTNSYVDLSGTLVDCDNNPLTDGWVEINVGPNTYNAYVTDGTYSLTFNNCTNETELTIQATNVVDLQNSDVETYSITPVMTIPEIYACVAPLVEYYHVTVNDSTTTFLNIDDSIGGLGDSLNIWASNVSGNDFNVSLSMSNVNGVGTYDETFVTAAGHFISAGDGSGDWLASNCGWNITCPLTVIFTEFGTNPGDFVEGSYSGDLEFSDPTQQGVTLPIEAEFRFMRD